MGLSLVGFLFGIIIVALLAVLGMKVVPTVVEFTAIKKAMTNARNTGTTVKEIQDSFDRQRDTSYIESVTGKDLEITRTSDGWDVSVAYQKKIALFGPASLLLEYEAATGGAAKKPKP
ncbi:DUF4845 domain-containing protein [Noviherbaspirillum denitrificans]|uniref:DUF4845 domain-containing protein n=1 Tax=Noviherbaspirillum denitrificans TaxID=1968433 RepID=A0A254T9S0_9BURK|nr:DUF4845 domain-containing protein [Noviherbaspirillum denitrificans]OWW19410.1 hypothetical protein AYR66_07705 [Noviherbaspirillum denitrificans]